MCGALCDLHTAFCEFLKSVAHTQSVGTAVALGQPLVSKCSPSLSTFHPSRSKMEGRGRGQAGGGLNHEGIGR